MPAGRACWALWAGGYSPGRTTGVGRAWQRAPCCQMDPPQGAPQVAPTNKINCLALPVRAPKAFIPADTGELRLAPQRAGTVGSIYRGGNGDRGREMAFKVYTTGNGTVGSNLNLSRPGFTFSPLNHRRRLSPGAPSFVCSFCREAAEARGAWVPGDLSCQVT